MINRLLDEYHHLNLWYFVSFIFGIVAYLSLDYEPNTIYIVALFILSIVVLCFRRYGIIWVFLSGLIVSFSFGVAVSKYRTLSIKFEALDHTLSATIDGTISSIKPITNGDQVTLSDVLFYKNKKYHDKFPSSIRLNIGSEYLGDFIVGDRIRVNAFLTPHHPSLLPGGYNFELYNFFSSIGAIGYAKAKPKIIYKKEITRIDVYIHKIRCVIYQRLIEVLGQDKGNFAAAILLGEGKGIDKSIMQNMRHSGISHILCVSGLHLSLVAMLFFVSTRFLLNFSDYISFRYDIKIIASIISLVGSFLYLMLSGMQIAATRAFIMTAIFILSVIIGRTPYPLRSISIAAFVILCMNPEYVMHPSFQLSFIAVLSLISGFEFYMKNQWILGSSKGIIANMKLYILANIYSSAIAGFATTPIVIYHFFISSNYGALSNLIAVPVMSFFMMPLAILSVILMPLNLDYYILKLLGVFIVNIITLARYISNLPGSVTYFGYITHSSVVIYMLGFFWLTLWQQSWRYLGWVIIAFSIFLMFLSPKPDLIFDPYNNNLAVKNKYDKLEIYAKHMSKFVRQYWFNWFGQRDMLIHKADIAQDNWRFVAQYGHKINICFNDLDCNADLVINNKNDYKCIATESLAKRDLEQMGTILVFCEKHKKCKLSYYNSQRFKF